jgi:hypothetical protein
VSGKYEVLLMEIDLFAKLKSEGWIQQFTASGTRLQEAIENYEMLGFEVKAIPIKDLNMDGCTVCFDDETDETMMIFTRKKSGDE